MKKWISLFFVLYMMQVSAQETMKPTNQFLITGDGVQEKQILINDLDSFQVHKINDLIITNHLGVKKELAKNLKGILIKDILEKAPIKVESNKQLNEYYFVCIAADGYKIVYSWNEIFNSETGKHIYLITEKDGMTIKNMPERILLITESDIATGRRHLRGLERIIVKKS